MTGLLTLIQDTLAVLLTGGADVQAAIAPLVAAAAISAAVSIGNSIFSSVSANKQKKKQLRAIAAAQRRNRNWYNRRYNEDATQRADAQRMLTRANEAIKKRTKAAYGRKAVTGGTDAALAATQQTNAEAMGNAVSSIVDNAEARKDNIEQQYRERNEQLESQKANVQAAASQAKRENTAAAATGAVNAMASVIGSDSTGASKVSGGNGAVKYKSSPNGSSVKGLKSNEEWLKNSYKSIMDYPELQRESYGYYA